MLEHITTKNIKYTQHFMNDRQHRGICTRDRDVQTYLEFAERKHDGHGAQILYFSDRSFHKMRLSGMNSAVVQQYEKRRNTRVVLSLDGTLITAMYTNKNHRRVR
jgi:hypothetical protein